MHTPLLVLLLLMLFASAFDSVHGQLPFKPFNSDIQVKAKSNEQFTFTLGEEETLTLNIIDASSDFLFSVIHLTPTDTSLYPLPIVLMDIQFLIKSQAIPVFNMVIEYKYSQSIIDSDQLEQQSLSYFVESSGATWQKFVQRSYIDSTAKITTQGTSSTTEINSMSNRIVVVGSKRVNVEYGSSVTLQPAKDNVFQVSKSGNTWLHVQMNPDVVTDVTIQEMRSVKSQTLFPTGIDILTPSNAVGILIKCSTAANVKGGFQYDAAQAGTAAKLNEVFAAKKTIQAIQYDQSEDSYFAVPTSIDGLVIQFAPQIRSEELETYVYLAVINSKTKLPAVVGRDVVVKANTKHAFEFYHNSENIYPILVATADKATSDIIFQISRASSESPYSTTELPNASSVALVFFQLTVPFVQNIEMSLAYDHRGNSITRQGITRSSLKMLMYSNGAWQNLPDSSISGAIITTELQSQQIVNANTTFVVVAEPGTYEGRNSSNTLVPPQIAMLTMALIVILFQLL